MYFLVFLYLWDSWQWRGGQKTTCNKGYWWRCSYVACAVTIWLLRHSTSPFYNHRVKWKTQPVTSKLCVWLQWNTTSDHGEKTEQGLSCWDKVEELGSVWPKGAFFHNSSSSCEDCNASFNCLSNKRGGSIDHFPIVLVSQMWPSFLTLQMLVWDHAWQKYNNVKSHYTRTYHL